MRKIQEVLRLHKECGLSRRDIAKACGIARSTVSDYLWRTAQAG
jgi:predicted transcriptional regulator